MESGDASNEDTPPCDPKSNNLTQKEQAKVISMLVHMETEDSLKRGAIMVVAKKLAWHVQTYSTIKLEIFFLLCNPTVLIYNSELGVINSSEFFHTKKLQKKHYVLPSIFILFFSKV